MQMPTDVSKVRWSVYFRWPKRLKKMLEGTAVLQTEGQTHECCNEP
jgi:hypothetical protein